MDNLKKLKLLGELAPDSMSAFMAFDKAALAEGVIPKKYKELIALAVLLQPSVPIAGRFIKRVRWQLELCERSLSKHPWSLRF